jgi:SAM-dependent methyltransferase
MAIFKEFATLYDLFYFDKDYKEEVEYLNKIFLKHNIPIKSILEYGCGTGKHGYLLAKDFGFKVHGIDISKEMIDLSPHHLNFITSVGDIRTYKSELKFDCIISMFHVLSYIISNEDLLCVFKNAFMHLHNRGLFVFDCWYNNAVLSIQPSVKIKRVSNKNISALRIAEPEVVHSKNLVNVNYTAYIEDTETHEIIKHTELHSLRFFSISEIEMLASISGFKLINVEELVTQASPSDKTWGLCFVLQKN